MTHKALLHALAVAGVALMVALAGALIVEPPGRTGLYFGAAVAFLFQAIGFWLLALWLFRDRLWIAYVAQMLGRVVVLGATAFLLIPAARLPAAPTLLALVTVFFVTTLMEPAFANAKLSTER